MNEAQRQKAEKLARRPYLVELLKDELSDGQTIYIASNPALPGCKSQGMTSEEAQKNLESARIDYIYFLLEDGLPVPDPMPTTASTANSYVFTYQFGETAVSVEKDPSSENLPDSHLITGQLQLVS
jgi:predicted RNase H-like HicB family nuclease